MWHPCLLNVRREGRWDGGRKERKKESRMEGKIKVTRKTNIWSFHQYLTSFPQLATHFWLQLI